MLIYVDICQYMLIYVIAHHKTGKVCQSFKIELLKWSYRADLCNHFCNLFEVSSTNRTTLAFKVSKSRIIYELFVYICQALATSLFILENWTNLGSNICLSLGFIISIIINK